MEVRRRQRRATFSADRLDRAIAHAETNGQARDRNGRLKISPKGAMGLMQVMPATARDPGFGVRPWNRRTEEDLDRVGREYRAKMYTRYGGDLSKMAAAYNAGPGAVDTRIKRYGANWLSYMPAETRAYVPRVLRAARGGR